MTAFLIKLVLLSSFADKLFFNIQSQLPEKCSAVVVGKAISKRLKTIPKESIEKGKKPVVKLYFKKGKGFKVVVENVEKLYRDIFREQFSALNNPLFRGDERKWERFKKKYLIEKLKEFKAPVVKVQKKTRKNEWYLLYLTKDLKKILRIDFYSSGKLYVSSIIRYGKFGRYSLPVKILVKVFGKKKTRAEVFKVENYKF